MKPLQIPAGTFGAYLFDCDGTIADSMPIHFKAWKKAMEGWNCEFSEDTFYAWAGIPVIRAVEMLNEQQRLLMPPEEISEKREAHYLKLLHEIRPVKSVVEQILLHHGKIPFAVVSGSPRDSVIKTLSVLNLIDRFPVIIGSEDYKNGKPHPEPFLKAAKLLGVKPERCLVFEDGELGIESARRAGMATVKVPSRV